MILLCIISSSTTINHRYLSHASCRGSEMHCADCLRVTVGTRQENEAFLELLKDTIEQLLKGV